jgi:hypothetical protein
MTRACSPKAIRSGLRIGARTACSLLASYQAFPNAAATLLTLLADARRCARDRLESPSERIAIVELADQSFAVRSRVPRPARPMLASRRAFSVGSTSIAISLDEQLTGCAVRIETDCVYNTTSLRSCSGSRAAAGRMEVKPRGPPATAALRSETRAGGRCVADPENPATPASACERIGAPGHGGRGRHPEP